MLTQGRKAKRLSTSNYRIALLLLTAIGAVAGVVVAFK